MAVSDMLQRGELQSDKIKLGAARVAQSVDGVFLMRFLESSSRVIKGKGHRYSGLKCNVSVYLFLFERPRHKRSIPCCGHQILLSIVLEFLADDRFDSGFEGLP